MLGISENTTLTPLSMPPGRSGWLHPSSTSASRPGSGGSSSSSQRSPNAHTRARSTPALTFAYHSHHDSSHNNTSAFSPHIDIPFSHHTHRNSCDACKLRAERIAEAKAKVQVLKTERRDAGGAGALPPWRPVGAGTPGMIKTTFPYVHADHHHHHPTVATPPASQVSPPAPRSVAGVTSKVDSGLRSADGSPRIMASRKEAVSAPANMTRPAWSTRGTPAVDVRPAPPSKRRQSNARRPSEAVAQSHVYVVRKTSASKLAPAAEPAAGSAVVKNAASGTLVETSAPDERDSCVACALKTIESGLIYPLAQATLVTAESSPEHACVVDEAVCAVAICAIHPRAVAAASHHTMEEQECCSHDHVPETRLHMLPPPAATDPPETATCRKDTRWSAETAPTAPAAAAPPPTAPTLVLPPRRPRVDMSNLTAVSTHLESAVAAMTTLHKTLTAPAPPPESKHAYMHASTTLVHLARALHTSYAAPARTCADPTLRTTLAAALQQVDSLAAQLAAVTRRKAADPTDRDVDASVLACARNLCAAGLKAVDAVSAVGITLPV
ncbi:hypothetical protein DFJ77DRAFT_545239 [Powellomyces hirtus]|nr:hypothetical protein DFJ77DRAFT_545239 [Powellomyces hirtus]